MHRMSPLSVTAPRPGEVSWSRPIAGLVLLAACLVLGVSQAEATACPQAGLRQYFDLIRPVPEAEMIPSHVPGSPMARPANPGVGDSWVWYTWKLAAYPVAEEKVCTVRGEGKHVYVVVEDSQWLTRVDQSDVDAVIERWDDSSFGPFPDRGIYDLDSATFGPVPDQLDPDPKVYVLYYDFDVDADGFFWAFDQYPDGSQTFASNETKVIYMNTGDRDPGGNSQISVQAHQLEHLIHWSEDADEQHWVDEGCAELAQWLFGRPDPVLPFAGNPDNNLTTWNASAADYAKSSLFLRYLYEHFGGSATIRDLVAEPLNGVAGIEQTLDQVGSVESFGDVVADWTVANYVDDPDLDDGRYGYAGEHLPPFAAVTRSSYPVPSTVTFVSHYAADYIRFTDGEPQRFFFDGANSGNWAVRAVKYRGGAPIAVEPIALDATDAGSLELFDFGHGYDEVVVVAANVSGLGATSYEYSMGLAPSSAESPLPLLSGLRLESVGSNPFADETRLRLISDRAGWVEVSVHNVLGRYIRGLESGRITAGSHVITWDGRDEEGNPAEGGVYFIRARTADGRQASHRLILIR
jgi:hypothetical protein